MHKLIMSNKKKTVECIKISFSVSCQPSPCFFWSLTSLKYTLFPSLTIVNCFPIQWKIGNEDICCCRLQGMSWEWKWLGERKPICQIYKNSNFRTLQSIMPKFSRLHSCMRKVLKKNRRPDPPPSGSAVRIFFRCFNLFLLNHFLFFPFSVFL